MHGSDRHAAATNSESGDQQMTLMLPRHTSLEMTCMERESRIMSLEAVAVAK